MPPEGGLPVRHKTFTTRNAIRAAGVIALSLGLVQCDQIREQIDKFREKPAPTPTTPAPPAPPVTDFAFDIDLRFDDASKKALTEKGIQIKLTTAYYGTPLEHVRDQADESGILSLGHDTIVVQPGDKIVNVIPNGLQTAKLKDVMDFKPSVIIRTYTSQRLEDGRMIDCSIYDNRFEVARTAPARITCRMFRLGRVQFTPAEQPAPQAETTTDRD